MSKISKVISIRLLICYLFMILLNASVPAQTITPISEEDRAAAIRQMESNRNTATWRHDAVDIMTQTDDRSSAERKARDDYWYHHLPPSNGSGSLGFLPLGADELDPKSNSLWVVAQFVSYKVFRPYQTDAAYTDIRFHILELIANRSSAVIDDGTSIDVSEPGGSIKIQGGIEKHYNLNYLLYDLTPDHTYLLQLRYHNEGNFFLATRQWDLTSGTAIPAGLIEGYALTHGSPQIGGHSRPAAIAAAKKILAEGGQ